MEKYREFYPVADIEEVITYGCYQGSYAGEVEIFAIAEMLDLSIIIYSVEDSDTTMALSPHYYGDRNCDTVISLKYLKLLRHYQVLRKCSEYSDTEKRILDSFFRRGHLDSNVAADNEVLAITTKINENKKPLKLIH